MTLRQGISTGTEPISEAMSNLAPHVMIHRITEWSLNSLGSLVHGSSFEGD